MLHKILFYSVCAAAFISLTACGGGSGGNSGSVAVVPPPPPPPPPPPANSAPVASLTVDKSSVEEGQPFTLDATGSSDPDGDVLTPILTQLSGPSPIPGGSFTGVTTLTQTAPEVSETEVAVFQIEVSDGTLSDTATVEVSFANISQSPKADFELVNASTISTRDGVRFVRKLGSEIRDFGELNLQGNLTFFRIETSDQGIPVEITEIRSTTAVSPDAIFHDAFGALRVDRFPFLAADEALNLVEIIKIDSFGGNDEFQSGGEFSIQAPCALDTPQQDHILVGQRGTGLTLLEVEYRLRNQQGEMDFDSATVKQEISGGESYCGFGYDLSGDLLGVDYDALAVGLFRISGPSTGDDFTLTFDRSVSLDLPTGSGNLQIVDTLDTGQGVLILLTDGEHEGSHHMIYVTERNNEFVQTRYSWQKGIPTNMEFSKLFSDGSQGIVIASSSSPEAIVFARPNGDFADLTGPQYLEIGLGAKDIVTARTLPRDDIGLLVTFPEQNEIRFLSPR